MADPKSADEKASTDAAPTVVVSHVSVTYRVLGGERRGAPSNQGERRSLRQLLLPGTGTPTRTREIHAVKDVSFVARHGESIGIIGRNGSGKSTLLRAVAGLIPPSEGRLWVSGEPSLLGVNAVLINKLSGERNIYVGGQALGLTTAEIDEKFDDIVEFSGIGDAVYLPMSTYSSGMGARLRFAISTAAAPDVLMIDEALATGDASFRQRSAERIAEIRDAAGTVFLVSHSNSNIREICDRVLWIDQGRLIMDGPTEQVLPAYEALLPKSKAPKKKARREPDVPGTVRWTGTTRFQTTRAITSETWAPGVAGCFVVSVERMAIARMVAPIAARLGWPMLWVRPGSIPEATRDELGRLAPERVIVAGGEGLVDAERYSRIEELVSGTVERLGTDDPARAAAQLVEAFPPRDRSTVYVTHPDNAGRTPVTSLQAAVTGRAVVVCDTVGVTDELTAALSDLRPRRLVLVGYEEEWPTDVVDALRHATDAEIGYSPEGGPMARAAGLWEDSEPGGRAIVSGAAAVEMLSATVASAHTRAPMLLVTSGRLPAIVHTALERLAPSEIVLAGAVEALPPDLRQTLGEIVTTGSPAAEATRPLQA
ncbi:ATP-binding cassette domain-containing protein [Janibacter cremeus]|uniref:ABC-type polysaccharide/polyol phosphate transport system ATPase subunit n=1 Tax=Janibacter cremeus TaxID=1285192 RepID=A0A852VUP3_9MICO|nr:ABC-type polysaccharide/polyol phosphate transport system ATPase subunit [Janibacter cremeus]